MAATFGVAQGRGDAAAAEFERDVVELVQAGKLAARVDDIEKVRLVSPPSHPESLTSFWGQVLYAVNPDKRRALYRDTLETGRTIQETTRHAFLRMQLCVPSPSFPLEPTLTLTPRRHQAGILVETPQDRKKREAKMAGGGGGGGGGDDYGEGPAFFEGSDEEMLQTA